MLRRETAAQLIIRGKEWEQIFAPIHFSKHLQRRQTCARNGFEGRSVFPIRGRDDEAGNTVLDQCVDHLFLRLWVFVDVCQNNGKALRRQRHLQRRCKFCEERVSQIVYDQADQASR